MTPIYKSLAFWTLVAGFLAFVAKFLSPNFPLSNQDILNALLFLLGLFGIVPAARVGALMRSSATVGLVDLLSSLQFWTLLAALASFVIHYYLPEFPFTEVMILSVILYVLEFFGIIPQARANGFMR